MINERVEIEICGWRTTVELDGLTQIEVHGIVNRISEKMQELAKETRLADSRKLALLTALEIGAELHRLQSQMDSFGASEGRKVEGMISLLGSALGDKLS